MLTKENILETLRNEVDINRFNIKSLGLFGSFARDEQTEESDIDIIYDFNSSDNALRLFYEFKDFLEEKFNKKVDLVSGEFMNPLKFNMLNEEVIYVY